MCTEMWRIAHWFWRDYAILTSSLSNFQPHFPILVERMAVLLASAEQGKGRRGRNVAPHKPHRKGLEPPTPALQEPPG